MTAEVSRGLGQCCGAMIDCTHLFVSGHVSNRVVQVDV